MVNKNFLFLFLFSILTLFLIVVAIIVRIKTYTPQISEEWKEYKNYDCNYQLNYPASWLIKTSQYKNPCETNKEATCIANQSVWIRNKNPSQIFLLRKRFFNDPPGDIGPQDQSIFYLMCYQTNYSSIEDWVEKSWLANNDDPIREREELGKINEQKLGEVSLPVFVASYPLLSRLHFIYKGHIYDIGYESGSKTQLEKNKEIMEKIVQSIKLF